MKPHLLALAGALALAACDTSPDAPPPDTSAPPDTIIEPGPERCKAPPPPRSLTGVRLERVFDHAFDEDTDPTRITQLLPSPFAPGQWYYVKHRGWVVRFYEDPSLGAPEIVLDIRDDRLFVENDEAGLMSLAFHPSGEDAFLMYQSPSRTGAFYDSVIARMAVRPDGTIDPTTEVELVRLPQPHFPHSGNMVLFGPDGYLYASFGDGGTVGSRVRSQDPHNFYGTLIRIDVDRADPDRGTPYAIPADNPFADGVGGAPEVFAYGLRNTWRLSIDAETGTVWGGDVGESAREEINRIAAGKNYGWPIMEGDICFRAETCDATGLEPPVLAYPHNEGFSATGGYVYRGGSVASLEGRYVFGDYMSGRIWSIPTDAVPGETTPRLEVESGFWVVSFAQSFEGELYAIRWSQVEHFDKTGVGGFYRLVPDTEAAAPDTFPRLLSQTGCTSEDDITEPAVGLIPYAPSAQLWSDGAAKRRFVSLPEGERAEVDAEGRLRFPEGTVLVKDFLFDGRLHETRLYIHHVAAGWRGYSYRWREDGSDAELLEAGLNETLHNGVFWRYPSAAQCSRCHTEASGRVLGLEVAQLREPLPGETEPQIQRWYEAGLLAPEVTAEVLEAFPTYVGLDAAADAEVRARSYLHSNCAGCHRSDGPLQSPMDLRFATSLGDARVCDVEPIHGALGLQDRDALRLLVPGSPEDSILYLRMLDTGEHRMPPLGTYRVHAEGVEAVRDWILGLERCP